MAVYSLPAIFFVGYDKIFIVSAQDVEKNILIGGYHDPK